MDNFKPQAYFIDLDGTLVEKFFDEKIHIDDATAMKTEAKKGTYIIISTGRSLEDVNRVRKNFDVGTDKTGYAIINNGSAIWNLKEDKLLFELGIEQDDFNKIFDYAKENNFAIRHSGENAFYTKGKIMSKFINVWRSRVPVSNDFNKIVYNNEASRKLGMICKPTKKGVSKVVKEMIAKFPNLEIVTSGSGMYIEITRKNVNKGAAEIFLSKHLNLDIKQCVHIGDSMNDLSAFKVVGKSVVMGNANKDLKEMGDFITTPINKGGVGNAIRSLSKH